MDRREAIEVEEKRKKREEEEERVRPENTVKSLAEKASQRREKIRVD